METRLDIVERLRTSTEWAHCKHSMREEAAAEIERLQAALKGALSMVDSFASGAGFSTTGRAEYESYRRALEPKP